MSNSFSLSLSRMSAFIPVVLITTFLCIRIKCCGRVCLKITPADKIRSRRVVRRLRRFDGHLFTYALLCHSHEKGKFESCFACYPWLWFCSSLSGLGHADRQATWIWHCLGSHKGKNSCCPQLSCIRFNRRTPSVLQSLWMWILYHTPVHRKIWRGGCVSVVCFAALVLRDFLTQTSNMPLNDFALEQGHDELPFFKNSWGKCAFLSIFSEWCWDLLVERHFCMIIFSCIVACILGTYFGTVS